MQLNFFPENPGQNILAIGCVSVKIWFATSKTALDIYSNLVNLVNELPHELPIDIKWISQYEWFNWDSGMT